MTVEHDESDDTSSVNVEDIAELREKAREMERKRDDEELGGKPLPKPTKSALPGGKTKVTLVEVDSQREHGNRMAEYWQKELQGQSTSQLKQDATLKKKAAEFTQENESSKGKAPNTTCVGTKLSSKENTKNKGSRGSSQKLETKDMMLEGGVEDVKGSNRTLVPQTTLGRDARIQATPGAYALAGPGAIDADDDDNVEALEQTEQNDTIGHLPELAASVEASMVTDAEKIYVAEDTKHDKHRRNMLIITLSGTFVIALSIFLLVWFLLLNDEDDTNTEPCDMPIGEQPVALRCECYNSTGDFYNSFSSVGTEIYAHQKAFLVEKGYFSENFTDTEDSCSVDNLHLLIAADIAEKSESGVEFWKWASPVFQLTIHTMIEMYLTMGGLDWDNDEDWLSDEICSWFGLKCAFMGKVIEEINIPENGLVGTLPTQIGLMGTVRSIEIFDNEDVIGSIPSQIGQLTELLDLTLRELALTGTIPTELGRLQKVDVIDISDNILTGNVPASLFNLQTLRVLRLSGNELSGTLSPRIGNATRLVELDFGENELRGSLPSELLRLTHLETLGLHKNNFSGTLPSFLGEMPHLSILFLHGSGFDIQSIPATFCESDRKRMITIDCPIDFVSPECDCCSPNNLNSQVYLVCETDFEVGEGG